MAKFESILEAIGGTPVVRIRKLAPAHVKHYVRRMKMSTAVEILFMRVSSAGESDPSMELQ